MFIAQGFNLQLLVPLKQEEIFIYCSCQFYILFMSANEGNVLSPIWIHSCGEEQKYILVWTLESFLALETVSAFHSFSMSHGSGWWDGRWLREAQNCLVFPHYNYQYYEHFKMTLASFFAFPPERTRKFFPLMFFIVRKSLCW